MPRRRIPNVTIDIKDFVNDYSSSRDEVLSTIWSMGRKGGEEYNKYDDNFVDNQVRAGSEGPVAKQTIHLLLTPSQLTARVHLVISDPRVKVISEATFEMCGNLVSVTMPFVQKIDYKAFYHCKNLRTVTAPRVETVGSKAFEDCHELEGVDLGNTERPSKSTG